MASGRARGSMAIARRASVAQRARIAGGALALFLIAAGLGMTLGTGGAGPAAAAGDPVIAAAGDIACDPAQTAFNGGDGRAGVCQQKATYDLLTQIDPAAVLALGDTQYYCGGFDAFSNSYALSWGKLRAKTYPVPGNHEFLTAPGRRRRRHRMRQQQHRRRRLLPVLRRGGSRGQAGAGVVQLRHRKLAFDRPQLLVRLRRRLRSGERTGDVAGERSLGAPEPMHPRLLAHPVVVEWRPGGAEQRAFRRGARRCGCGRDLERSRPYLRAVAPGCLGPTRRAKWDPRVRRRYGRSRPHLDRVRGAEQPSPKTTRRSACSS